MKKEKTIKTYQRKTKSGKITTVKSHTAKYDAAAEVAKKAARKKGAGGELKTRLTKMPDPKLELQNYLDELKKSRSGASSDTTKTKKPAPKKKLKKPVGGGITGLEPKESKKGSCQEQKKTAPKSSGLSSTEFKAWYHDPKSKEGKAAAKKLKEQVGAEKYKELNKKANDSYSSRGHISLFKSIGSDSTSKTVSKKTLKKPVGGGITGLEPKKKSTSSKATAKEKKSSWTKTSDTPLHKKGDMAVGSMNVGKRSIDLEVRPTDKGYEVSMYDRKGNIGHLANIHIKTLSDLSKHVKSEVDPKRKLTSKLMDSGEIEYGTVRVKSKKLKSQEV
nr:MAG: hypothetical protein [Bacteriophage sp.]